MKTGNIVIFSKNHVTNKPEDEVKFIVYKYALEGTTLKI
jgi:hypothetical protein